MDRFWRWVYGLAERNIRSNFMKRWRHDRRCPNCGRWGALYGWTSKHEVDYLHITLTCRACNHTSTWLEDAMAPIPVDPTTYEPIRRHPMAGLESNNKR